MKMSDFRIFCREFHVESNAVDRLKIRQILAELCPFEHVLLFINHQHN